MMESTQFRAMNTDVVIMVDGSQPDAAFEQAEKAFAEAEHRFSRFIPNSELSRLNESAGTWFTASPHMMQVLRLAKKYHKMTNGLFNPMILPSLQNAGYAKSYDLVHEFASQPSQPAPMPANMDELELDENASRVFLPANASIDLGGIVKGWTSELTARKLAERWPAVAVNAGGDMFLMGKPDGADDWTIGVQDPFHPQLDLMDITATDGAVATSSVTVRKWVNGGRQLHHIIDPRDGQPAQTHWAAVTVLAPSGAQAEAFAKALLIGGESLAAELDSSGVGCPFLAIGHNGSRYYYDRGNKYEC